MELPADLDSQEVPEILVLVDLLDPPDHLEERDLPELLERLVVQGQLELLGHEGLMEAQELLGPRVNQVRQGHRVALDLEAN